MPRTRNRRRVVDTVSDHIEEDEDDDAPQRQEVDAVDADGDEEDQQPRPPPRKKLSRSAQGESSRSAAADDAPESEHEEDAQDATPAFDGDAFGNKPLSRHDGQKLQGMAADWNMIETNLKESAFSLLTEVSTAVAEYADESTAEKVITSRPPPPSCMLTRSIHTQELQRLDVLMREIIDIDVEIRSHEQTLKDLHQQVVAGDEVVSLLSVFHIPLS
jgi:E3 SUMO-protein ligase NSE2